jgi:tRNA threonylcarbamoyladenosine biosynthesis protein TsaB
MTWHTPCARIRPGLRHEPGCVMNIVAIETATETIGVAARADSGAQAAFTLSGKRRHVETLIPALEDLLTQLELAVNDVDLVAVDLGPGLFTGLRVGVAAAKGLAQALGIGVIGISSLDILTSAATQCGHRGYLLAAVDARRGEVFASVRELRNGQDEAQDVVESGLFAPEVLAESLRELGGVDIVGVGDGAQRYVEILGAVPGVDCLMDSLGFPPPLTLLDRAASLVKAGAAPQDPQLVVPIYMREADAKSNFAQVTTG